MSSLRPHILSRWLSLVLAALMLVLCIAGCRCGISSGSPALHRLAYPFCHAGLLHFALNAWCLLSVAFSFRLSPWLLLFAYIVAAAVPPFVLSPIPTVGFSGALYFLLGAVALSVQRRVVYQAYMLVYIAVGFFLPACNAFLHLWCYALGLFVAFINAPLPCLNR